MWQLGTTVQSGHNQSTLVVDEKALQLKYQEILLTAMETLLNLFCTNRQYKHRCKANDTVYRYSAYETPANNKNKQTTDNTMLTSLLTAYKAARE